MAHFTGAPSPGPRQEAAGSLVVPRAGATPTPTPTPHPLHAGRPRVPGVGGGLGGQGCVPASARPPPLAPAPLPHPLSQPRSVSSALGSQLTSRRHTSPAHTGAGERTSRPPLPHSAPAARGADDPPLPPPPPYAPPASSRVRPSQAGCGPSHHPRSVTRAARPAHVPRFPLPPLGPSAGHRSFLGDSRGTSSRGCPSTGGPPSPPPPETIPRPPLSMQAHAAFP